MTTTQILVLSFAGLVVLLAGAIFTVAFRKGDPDTARRGRLDRAARKRDRSVIVPEPEPVAAGVAVLTEVEDAPAPPDPLETREVLSEDEYGATRRQFLNRAIGATFGVFLLQLVVYILGFLWPKLKAGAFGGRVNAGNLDDIADAVFLPDGRVQPFFVPAAQSYVMPFQGDLAKSSFAGLPVLAGGYMALWQRCVHLGCRVPPCNSSQGFECPCHGSKYNYHGEYEDGPAPRNLDRFPVELNDRNELIIDTGTVLQTARSTTKSTEYPQGPSCIS